jgi:hypothetical protein
MQCNGNKIDFSRATIDLINLASSRHSRYNRPVKLFQEPLPAGWKNMKEHIPFKLLIGTACMTYWAIPYFTLNHHDFPHYHSLPKTWFDQAPVLPWSILVYLSIFFLCSLGLQLHPTRESIIRYWKSVVITYAIAFAIFALFPTKMARAVTPEMSPFLERAFAFTRTVDEPTNCFPSLHLGNCFLVVFAYRQYRIGGYFLIWSILIGASVLTTAQHMFWDIPGGIAIATIGTFLAEKYWKSNHLHQTENQ